MQGLSSLWVHFYFSRLRHVWRSSGSHVIPRTRCLCLANTYFDPSTPPHVYHHGSYHGPAMCVSQNMLRLRGWFSFSGKYWDHHWIAFWKRVLSRQTTSTDCPRLDDIGNGRWCLYYRFVGMVPGTAWFDFFIQRSTTTDNVGLTEKEQDRHEADR